MYARKNKSNHDCSVRTEKSFPRDHIRVLLLMVIAKAGLVGNRRRGVKGKSVSEDESRILGIINIAPLRSPVIIFA